MELLQVRTAFTEFVWAGRIPLALIITSYWVYQIIYNLYFHPLSKIPGPWIAAISDIPYCSWMLGGRQPYKLLELHNKYGHAVRVAPNEVSFNTAQSWKDIYGQKPGRPIFIKGTFYDGGNFAGNGISSIISERRPEVHKEMRSTLAGAFSDRAIVEQESLVATSVDKLVRLVGIEGSTERGVDVSILFESMTFDITGDLAFGETFGALGNDERHPWISTTLSGLMQGVFVDIFNRYPTIGAILRVLFRSKLKKAVEGVKTNEQLCYDLVRRRITRKTNRKDFLTRILESRDPRIVSDRQIAAHASDFVIAGSDTTASSLAAVVYYLLQNTYSMAKVTDEIRTTFAKYSDISYLSTASMPYLRAVILEALRMYPPTPMGLPRLVPDGGDVVDGCPLPGGITVYTSPLSSCMASANFEDPWSFKPERWPKSMYW
ncbi:cytochrome P450 [Daldinia bambusicola]|nr:cytochrome P450 [Daldinia bambusicola]